MFIALPQFAAELGKNTLQSLLISLLIHRISLKGLESLS
jgi:hypothetical protein